MAENAGITVVICTRNRAKGLRQTLESLAPQPATVRPWDILVVDNASSDDTEAVVREFAARSPVPVHYLAELTPGVSHARNAAAHFASREIVAFIDDDEDVGAGWLEAIARAFEDNPGADVVGGRILPRWLDPPPPWFTDALRGPATIIDRGDTPFVVTRDRWMCLAGGNMAWRRRALLALGGFSPEYPRAQDREILVRALLQDRHGVYAPDAVVYHRLQGERLTRAFFRNWSRTEGRMRAGYAYEELFTREGHLRPLPDDVPKLLGVSRFLYREWLHACGRYLGARLGLLRGDPFPYELRLLALTAYLRRRIELTGGGAKQAPAVTRSGTASEALSQTRPRRSRPGRT